MFNGKKNLLANTHWRTFSIWEGATRVVNLGILKTIAEFLVAPILTIFVTGLIGLVRCIGGLILALRSGFEIYPNSRKVLGSMIIGIVISYTTIVPLYIFFLADVSILSFALMIVAGFAPGALLTKFSSRGKISLTQTAGFLAVIAGVFMFIGWVNFDTVPLWVWMLVTLPIAAFLKDLIVRIIGTAGVISPWVHNFWVGISMMIFSGIALMTYNAAILTEGLFLNNLKGYLWLVVISGIFYLLIVFNRQKSYRVMGGIFAKKKLTVSITALAVALIVDLIFFGFLPNFSMIIALVLILVGYMLVDNLLAKKG